MSERTLQYQGTSRDGNVYLCTKCKQYLISKEDDASCDCEDKSGQDDRKAV